MPLKPPRFDSLRLATREVIGNGGMAVRSDKLAYLRITYVPTYLPSHLTMTEGQDWTGQSRKSYWVAAATETPGPGDTPVVSPPCHCGCVCLRRLLLRPWQGWILGSPQDRTAPLMWLGCATFTAPLLGH